MTIPRLVAINKHQRQYPPLYWLVARYMGHGEKKAAETADKSGLNENGESLFDLFPIARG